MKFAFIVMHAFIGSIIGSIVYVATSMTLVFLFGDSTARGANGLQVLAVIFIYPIILFAAMVVSAIITKLVNTDKATKIIYITISILAFCIGIYESFGIAANAPL